MLPINQWLRAKDYYDKKDNPEEKANIRLYLGRSLVDDGKYDEAVIAYKEGLDFALKADAYSLSGYLCSFMGDLYLDKKMATKAMEKYRDAADFHQKGGNLRSWALALKELSISYAYNDLYEDALFTLKKADSIINITNDKFAKSIIINNLGLVYEEMHDYESAENYYLSALDISNLDKGTFYLNLSLVSIKKGDNYKAQQYFNKAIPDLTKDVVLYQMYQIEKAEKNIDSAIFYLELYQECLDSILLEQNKINVHEIEKKYDKSRIINEKNLMQLRLQRLIIAGLVLSIVFIITFLLYRKFKKRQLRIKENEVMEMDKKYRVLSAQLKEKDRILDEKEKLSESFLKQKQELESLRETSFNGKLELIKQSLVGRKIVELSNKGIASKSKILKEKGWKSLEKMIKSSFPDLYALFIEVTTQSSEDTFRLCLLSFFELKTKEEAFLLSKSDEAVRQSRSRLRRLLNIDDSQRILSYFKKTAES